MTGNEHGVSLFACSRFCFCHFDNVDGVFVF